MVATGKQTLMQMDSRSIGSNSTNIVARQERESQFQQALGHAIQRVTIKFLSDNVLLDIFDFYQAIINEGDHKDAWNLDCHWQMLAHVCRQWRYVIFESPIRLNLELVCTGKSPLRTLLDIWPPIPIAIVFYRRSGWFSHIDKIGKQKLDDLLAASEHRDRVRRISITNPESFLWNRILTTMEEPFPTLASLSLESSYSEISLPDTFLNGSAPCLQNIFLMETSFPSLPRLLSSTSDLTSLYLVDIPKYGYIPPATMATCLFALPKLKSLAICFKFPTYPQQTQEDSPPPARFVLPTLTKLQFKGVSEYLELLTAHIDAAPLLYDYSITFLYRVIFLHQPELVDTPQIIRFFGHLDSFKPSRLALVFDLYSRTAAIVFPSKKRHHSASRPSWTITCTKLSWQVISVAHICSQILPLRSSVKSLIIKYHGLLDYIKQNEMDSSLWAQLFNSFTSVQDLYIPAELESSIGSALQRLASESATEPFPSLRNLSIIVGLSDKTSPQGIQSFIASRQKNGRPITFSRQ